MELNYKGSGFANIESKDRECHFFLNESEGGILLRVIVNDPFASSLLLPDEISQLKVELSNGVKLLLIDAFRSEGVISNISSKESIYSYSAKYLISDFSKFENVTSGLNCVLFEASGILGWGGISAYQIDDNYGVKQNSDNKITLLKNQDYEINYLVTGTMLPVHKSHLFSDNIELNQRSVIEIKYTTSHPIDNYFELFEKIKYLIELNTIEKIAINNIQGYSNTEYTLLNDDKKIPSVLKIISPIIKSNKVEKNYFGMYKLRVFTLENLMENNSIEIYFNNFEKLKPIIELYIEMLYLKNISSVRLFLNVVQALETYHSRFKSNKITEFRKRVDSISKDYRDNTKEFLLANSKGFITLESRIADLVLAEFQIYFKTGQIGKNEFPNVIAKTRNYYIHYDEKLKLENKILTEEELSIYNLSLLILLDYYIYSELGFKDSQELMKKLKYRWGDVENILSQQNAFKNRFNSNIEGNK
ncbi:hypothetical protein EA459_07870 [Streptococcus dysgalactiae subsp. dysgalactiae]|nr:HEPN domain-containing protein [Streptococcus dysgalactiae]QGG98492.1 hypothetical protein EA459_07870 [Streptococcus dysgalactiae subsp. dysgalactiae]